MIGIAIVTYNRLDRLQGVVDAVQRHTTSPYEVVVADDGSGDGTADWCRENGIRVVSGENRGVCWNKNRGLFALRALGCDPILLLEDDAYPEVDGWDEDWAEATAQWHHVAYAHQKIAPQVLSGSGTPDDPFVNNKATAQCSSISSQALDEVGYLDTRFKGYGVGHAEWTTRIKRAGYGFKRATLPTGAIARANLYITGGIVADDAPSSRDKAQVEANKLLFKAIKQEPIHRDPWSDEDERSTFVAEQEGAGIPYEGLVDLTVPVPPRPTLPEPAPEPERRTVVLGGVQDPHALVETTTQLVQDEMRERRAR